MDISGKAAKTETTLALGGRIWDVLKYLGITDQITLAASLVGVALWSWFMTLFQSAPLWVILLTGLAVLTLLARLSVAFRMAWLVRGQKSFDLSAFADECIKYYQDVGMVLGSQPPASHHDLGGTKDDMHLQWQRNVDRSNQMSSLLLQRFGPQTFAIAHQFKLLGIPEPNMFHFPHGDTGGACVYIGMVGELLKKGLLDEARKLDAKATWGASFH
jgi:hypothetical protein